MVTQSDLNPLQTLPAAPLNGLTAQSTKIAKAAEEFEALVLAQLLAPIFTSVEKSGLTSAGPGEDAFEAMLQEEYAKAMAARGGVGIADQVKANLIALQANSQTEFQAIIAPHENPTSHTES